MADPKHLTIAAAAKAYRRALDEYPECLQAQQRHFAATVPAPRRWLKEAVGSQLGRRERELLFEALQEIDGDPLDDKAKLYGSDEDWL